MTITKSLAKAYLGEFVAFPLRKRKRKTKKNSRFAFVIVSAQMVDVSQFSACWSGTPKTVSRVILALCLGWEKKIP